MAKRRGHGEGSIFKRDGGKWVGEVDLGRDAEGKRQRKTIYGKTRREVSDKIKELHSTIQAGGQVDPTKQTVAEHLARWLKDSAANTVRPTTLESYTRYVRLHALPTLGQIRLIALTPVHLQDLYTDRLAAGKSRRTVQYLHAILHRALEQAVRWELIPRNPADAVDAPRPARREIKVFSPGQIDTLITTMRSDPLLPLYYLSIVTGCRRAELVALRWKDVDWQRPALNINRAAEEIKTGIIFEEPKTDRSRRSIPILEEAATMLKAHLEQQLQEQQQAGAHFTDQGLVFCKPSGSPVRPSHLTRHFGLLLKRAQLPHIWLHDLRHTHATMLLAAGVHPKVVSERLGHSTITLTMDTYSHVLPTMQDEVNRKLRAILSEQKPDP